MPLQSSLSEISQFPPAHLIQTDDERFMVEALKEAWAAFRNGEVPVGVVIVYDGKVIARGKNQVELLQDATAHAEMLAIGSAAQALGGWRLEGCTLYSTLEPCCMCGGAMFLSRISRLVWGAPDIRHGANGSFIDLFSLQHPTHKVDVTSQVLSSWCAQPLQLFFRKRRSSEMV
jgi:tRNA(adenine34) deaminase